MPTCLQINSPVAVQILEEARTEGETMQRESAKIRERRRNKRGSGKMKILIRGKRQTLKRSSPELC